MDGSPFVLIFSGLGIPAAAGILNLVVLSAAVSVYNSGAYSNARMLYSLALQGNAPAFFAKLNRHGAPYRGTLFSSLCTAIIVLLNWLFPGKVFLYVVSIATAAALLTWGMIAPHPPPLPPHPRRARLQRRRRVPRAGLPLAELCLSGLPGAGAGTDDPTGRHPPGGPAAAPLAGCVVYGLPG